MPRKDKAIFRRASTIGFGCRVGSGTGTGTVRYRQRRQRHLADKFNNVSPQSRAFHEKMTIIQNDTQKRSHSHTTRASQADQRWRETETHSQLCFPLAFPLVLIPLEVLIPLLLIPLALPLTGTSVRTATERLQPWAPQVIVSHR